MVGIVGDGGTRTCEYLPECPVFGQKDGAGGAGKYQACMQGCIQYTKDVDRVESIINIIKVFIMLLNLWNRIYL